MRDDVEVRFGMRIAKLLQNFRLKVKFDEGVHLFSLNNKFPRFVKSAGDSFFLRLKERVGRLGKSKSLIG